MNSALIFVVTLSAVAGLVRGGGCLSDSEPIFGRGFTVRCSRDHHTLSVEVICSSDDWTAFPKGKLNLVSVTQTNFINCSFPLDLSLVDIFHSLNVNNSRTISFKQLRSAPNRQNLRGLSTTSLEFVGSNFTELPSDLLYDVLDVEKLYLPSNNLVSIPENFLRNFSKNLRRLDFMENKLRKIAKNDFAHLEDVSMIVLHANEISEIEEGAFDDLVSLESIDLGRNQLRTLSPGIFRHLTRLEKINLSFNPIDELPSDLLTSIKDCHLQNFRMSFADGSLRTLPSGFFKNLAFLNDVELVGSQLESLPADLFSGTSELVNLTLNNNNLRRIPAGFLNDTKKLKNLDLGNNFLEALPEGIFKELDDLDNLDISYNKLTTLKSNVLIGLQTLTTFQASHNNLTEIDDDFCKYVGSVEEVDFSHNQLTFEAKNGHWFDHTSVFFRCSYIRGMNLSNNMASNLFGDWDLLLTKKWTDLSYNNFSELTTDDIMVLVNEETVDLRNNQIATINFTTLSAMAAEHKKHTQSAPKTSTVMLGNNPLHCDCHMIDFIRYLNSGKDSDVRKFANIDFDKGGSLKCASPPEFLNRDVHTIRPEDLNCILETDVADDACATTCTCREFPEKKVLSVDCSNKNLTKLPTSIRNEHNWSIELNISHNKLHRTPSLSDPHLVNVTTLDLSSNNISSVSIDVFSKSLVSLKLHNNSISRLDSEVVKYLVNNNNLRAITLHANPWMCECEDRHFLSFVQKKAQTFNLHEVLCYRTNDKMYEMTVNDLCQSVIVIIVSASLLVAFVGIVVGILAALYYKYQKEIKIWLYSKQMCLWFVTEDELDKDKTYDAFVSFSHKDEEFVVGEIVAKLEDGPMPYKLCLHYRDWLAGEWIPVQIAQSVEESRRTIVVLSPNYMESVWGRMEFRAAYTQALKEGRTRLIIIIYGEIENMDSLDPEMKAYLSMNTYVKWGDPWFWDKLRYALPHRHEPSKRKSRNIRLIEDHAAQRPVNNAANSAGKSDAISMSKLANDSAKLLDPGFEDDKTAPSC